MPPGLREGLQQAAAMVRPRGTVILKSTVHEKVPIDTAPLIVNEITLVGSRCGRFEPALRLLSGGALHVEEMIAEQFPIGRSHTRVRAGRAKGRTQSPARLTSAPGPGNGAPCPWNGTCNFPSRERHDMPTWAIIVLIAVIAVVCVAAWYFLRQQRSRRLRAHFGPEYDRLVHESHDRHRGGTGTGAPRTSRPPTGYPQPAPARARALCGSLARGPGALCRRP